VSQLDGHPADVPAGAQDRNAPALEWTTRFQRKRRGDPDHAEAGGELGIRPVGQDVDRVRLGQRLLRDGPVEPMARQVTLEPCERPRLRAVEHAPDALDPGHVRNVGRAADQPGSKTNLDRVERSQRDGDPYLAVRRVRAVEPAGHG
jgi:hypothetical protein